MLDDIDVFMSAYASAEGAAWCAVRHVYDYSIEDVEIIKASFSPWEFVNLEQAIHATAPWRVERALMMASWYANADFCKVCDLWEK